MARTKGARNEGFEARRTALIAALRDRLRAPGPAPSMRELASAADVTVPTLRHYFADREGVLRAVMKDELADGSKPNGPLEVAATPSGPFAASVRDLLRHADEGFVFGGLTDSHAMGLAEGIRADATAADYLRLALDPTIDAFAARLRAHQECSEMRTDVDARAAAVQLLSPLVIARLHQDRFGGRMANPIDLAAMLDQQAEAFVRGYAA
jgi:AcrR family transcriptional regulator